jgi:hypothetical protein
MELEGRKWKRKGMEGQERKGQRYGKKRGLR